MEIYDEGGELVDEGKKIGCKVEKIEFEGLELGIYNVKVFLNGSVKSNYCLGIIVIVFYVDDYFNVEEVLDFGNIFIGEIRVFNGEMGCIEGCFGCDIEDWVSFIIDEESLVGIDLIYLC